MCSGLLNRCDPQCPEDRQRGEQTFSHSGHRSRARRPTPERDLDLRAPAIHKALITRLMRGMAENYHLTTLSRGTQSRPSCLPALRSSSHPAGELVLVEIVAPRVYL